MAVKLLCFVISLLLGMGASQMCDLTNTLTTDSTSFIPIDVNLTQTSCFICPEAASSFTINNQMISSGAGIDISSTTLMISDWSVYDVSRTDTNRLSCIQQSDGRTITTLFFTLTPGPLVLLQPVPTFFFENSSSNTSILCVNNNRRPDYNVQTQVWTDSAGTAVEVVGGESRRLVLPQLRDNAGTYTCGISSIPIIPVVMYDVVIYYAPEVSTFTRDPEYVEVGMTLTLKCGYDGVPEANVTWTMNSTVLNETSDISISSVPTGVNRRTTTLTWNNVPVSAQGVYQCLFNNVAGSASGSYTIPVATTPEPAAMFRVTGTTNTTISLAWDKQFNGLLTIAGGDLEYFTGSENLSSISVTEGGTTAELTDLIPFQVYNITLYVTNRLGRSAPVSLTQQTDSNFLSAPSVTLTAESSTELRLNWTAPTASVRVESAFNWTVEFSRSDGSAMQTQTVPASTLTLPFDGLLKGTEYRARVRGINSRGLGAFSDYVMMETIVDPPSVPNNVVATPLSSFAINVTWEVPTDMGGRPVTNYRVAVTEQTGGTEVYNQTGGAQLYRFINDMSIFQEDTVYIVSVAGSNTAGVGDHAIRMVTTDPIERPQPVLGTIDISEVSNISATVSWDFPGGNVTTFIVTITEQLSQESRNFTVNGTELSLVPIDLKPATTYDVVIRTMNDNGTSIPSLLFSFSTRNPPPPVITVSPESGPYPMGFDIFFTCTTPDNNRQIQWSKRDGPDLDPPVFLIEGSYNRSVLTIRDARMSNTGTYICRVGETSSELSIVVFTLTTTAPPDTGISQTTIIIAACVAGGGALILIVLVVIIVMLCCCCRSSDDEIKYRKKGGFSPKKKAGKDLFEISNTFTPTTNTGITRESNVSFTMPEEYNTHTSFNTMEKQNKVERSHSPDMEQPTSFGGARDSSGAAANDFQMPPASNDGTML